MRLTFSNIIRTKEELNRHISDDQIIYHYFGDFELDTFYISPRGESSPSLIFDVYGGDIKWRDFGNSNYPKDAVEFVQYKYKCKDNKILNYAQTLELIYDEIGTDASPLIADRTEKKKEVSIKYRKAYYQWELDYWLDYYIPGEMLLKYKIFPGELWYNGKLWGRSQENDPCYIYMWDIDLEIYKFYRPNAPIEWYKGNTMIKKFFANNTRNHVQGLEFLPKKGELLFITKSYKEVLVFMLLGIPAIAPHSENHFINEGLMKQLKQRFKYIYVNYDNDDTGISKSIQYSKFYKLKYWNVPINYIGCKDPSDLVKMMNMAELKLNLNARFKRDNVEIKIT